MERSSAATILLFVRWPEPGRVKTRLAAGIGPEAACRAHTALAEQCCRAARGVREAQLVVCGTGAPADAFGTWLKGADAYWEQPGGDLGERLGAMVARAFREGAGPVLAIGSDAPTLGTGAMEEAVRSLQSHDVCLLPAEDGGYVLIGLRREAPVLFEEMPWSTAGLLAATRERCAAAGLSLHLGATFPDVDTAEDWKRLAPFLRG